MNVQLKATIATPVDHGTHLSYSLAGIHQYDDLRTETLAVPRILAVLFLPAQEDRWLQHSVEALTLQRCAYWVSLRGAQASSNIASQTVYLPKRQVFNSEGLVGLITKLSRIEHLHYEQPQ